MYQMHKFARKNTTYCRKFRKYKQYSKFNRYKDVELLKSYVDKCDNCNINLLVNIGPNKDGELEEKAKELVKEMFK